ncbi:MAG: SUF system Fe-S cluster assembly regulator [Gammaproteobacteria bacterium]
MLRISRLTDYGTMILVYLVDQDAPQLHSANDVATQTGLALPTVQKLLKSLAKAGLVDSVRGAEGGYQLARDPAQISAAEILDALEGPLAITECSTEESHCELEANCQVGSAWQKINKAIRLAMHDIRLSDLRDPPKEFPITQLILKDFPHSDSPDWADSD